MSFAVTLCLLLFFANCPFLSLSCFFFYLFFSLYVISLRSRALSPFSSLRLSPFPSLILYLFPSVLALRHQILAASAGAAFAEEAGFFKGSSSSRVAVAAGCSRYFAAAALMPSCCAAAAFVPLCCLCSNTPTSVILTALCGSWAQVPYPQQQPQVQQQQQQNASTSRPFCLLKAFIPRPRLIAFLISWTGTL